MIALLLSTVLAGTVVLRSDARIAGPTVELGEIAEFHGLETADATRLAKLQVGTAPGPGNVRGVRRQDAALALRSAGIDIALLGAPLCRARADVATLPAREIEDAARNALATLFSNRDYEIELMRPVADLSVAVAETRRDVYVDLGRREPQPGAWNVPVEIGIDGVRVQTVWVNLDVKLYEEQPVAARDLRRGDAIDASCWRLQRTLVEATAPRSATPHGLMGATSTRDIAAGLRIAETDVRREPLVRPGDSVELEVVRGSIRARSRAIARGQGALGDRVEVQCGDGQRRLVGIVVQRGLVRVELASSPRNSR